MYEVITLGSATQDIYLSSKNFALVESDKFITKKGLAVALGSKMKMDQVFISMGGTGANAAVTFARQGFQTAYFGRIGQDLMGEAVKKELAENGVDLSLIIESDKQNTAFSVILSKPEAGRSILKKLGACHEMTEADLDLAKLKAKWLYLASLSGNSWKVVESIVDYAVKNGIKIAANPVGQEQLSEGLDNLKGFLDKIDVLFVNQEEASIITGVDYDKEKELFAKLDELVKGLAIMTKGPEGVVVSDGENLYRAGIPESGLVDRTGAGDAFGSGFTAGYLEKQDIEYAIQLATANATAVLQEFGAARGLLKKGDWGPWQKVEVIKEKI